jgi:pyruvate dehydrogenase E2 component (dihydrolipoamide acetyltransferase)
MANKTINIPDLGEAEDVEVIEICAKVGDQVDSEDPIIVLESDKAAMEIPASAIGKVISIEVSVGDTVNSGLPFLQIEVSDDAAKRMKKPLQTIQIKRIILLMKNRKILNLNN